MATRNCTVDRNRKDCTCTYEPCSRKGLCCDCLRDHWRNKELPGCLFPPEVESTYDRSLSTFIAAWKRRGY